MAVFTADPDADLEGALVEFRRMRRRKRLEELHWVDALYKAYLTALVGGAAVLIGAGLIGDGFLTPDQLDRLTSDGHDWLNLAMAAVVALGVRSGSRGGPIALERAEVRHVLLAPVDRTIAVRGPALRQLRFLLFVAAVVGAIGGVLAGHRLPEEDLAWAACGALFASTSVALGYGIALLFSAMRWPRPAASLLALALVVVALLAALQSGHQGPANLALWPLDSDPLSVLPIIAALAALAAGLSLVGNVSVEAAERRSTLVGQLRFAATLQDVRTVIVLRRQLAMELPRLQPWVAVRAGGTRRFPVWARGVRGVLRWPAARVARLVLLGVIAGLAARGAWVGTSPLVVVAGLALFIAALDAVEPLAQEIDHPTRRSAFPLEPGYVEIRHVPVAVAAMLLVCVVAFVSAVLADPSMTAAAIAAACILPAVLGAVAGATVSVVSGAPSQTSETWSLMPPEVAGMRVVYRTGWPPALAVLGVAPVLVARTAARNDVPAAPAALAAGAVLLVLFVLVCGWVRHRDRMHAWWRVQMDAALPSSRPVEVADDG